MVGWNKHDLETMVRQHHGDVDEGQITWGTLKHMYQLLRHMYHLIDQRSKKRQEHLKNALLEYNGFSKVGTKKAMLNSMASILFG